MNESCASTLVEHFSSKYFPNITFICNISAKLSDCWARTLGVLGHTVVPHISCCPWGEGRGDCSCIVPSFKVFGRGLVTSVLRIFQVSHRSVCNQMMARKTFFLILSLSWFHVSLIAVLFFQEQKMEGGIETGFFLPFHWSQNILQRKPFFSQIVRYLCLC